MRGVRTGRGRIYRDSSHPSAGESYKDPRLHDAFFPYLLTFQLIYVDYNSELQASKTALWQSPPGGSWTAHICQNKVLENTGTLFYSIKSLSRMLIWSMELKIVKSLESGGDSTFV